VVAVIYSLTSRGGSSPKILGALPHQPIHHRVHFLRSPKPKRYELHIGLHLKSIISCQLYNGLDPETRRNEVRRPDSGDGVLEKRQQAPPPPLTQRRTAPAHLTPKRPTTGIKEVHAVSHYPVNAMHGQTKPCIARRLRSYRVCSFNLKPSTRDWTRNWQKWRRLSAAERTKSP